jgi:RND family efflux transporter MFP subunit
MSERRHASLAIHSDEHPSGPHRVRRMRTLSRVKIIAACVLGLLLLGAAITMIGRFSQTKVLASGVDMQSRQYVVTVRAKSGAGKQMLSLPGTLQGYMEAPISARINGYLVRWTRDIGSRVEKGEVLAEISNPETDQQLAQALAARQQTASTLALAKVSSERWQNLRRENAVSQQEYDERHSTYVQAEANLAAADANIRRLKELESFKRVVAPFSGIVARRNVNVGDLIDAGGNASRPLFLLTQTDPLRVYVYVPQAYSQQVRPGQTVSIRQAELPGQAFDGKIVRTAGAIDVASRSLQTEISLPNTDGKLLPGAYVDVSLPISASEVLTVPTNALLLRSEGPRVAVVDRAGRVRLQPVTLGKDFGLTVQVLNGLTASEDLVLNPSDSLADGDLVMVSNKSQGTTTP